MTLCENLYSFIVLFYLLTKFESEINYHAVADARVIKGIIDGLKMYMCTFHPKHRNNTRYYILHPCVVNINNSQQESTDLNIHIKFSDIMINITPLTIELISKAVHSITMTQNTKTAKLTPINYYKIWEERIVEEKHHWYIRIGKSTIYIRFINKNVKVIKYLLQILQMMLYRICPLTTFLSQKLSIKMKDVY